VIFLRNPRGNRNDCSGDDLRPALASVFIDGDNYVATDAHKLIIVKRNESDESVIAKMKESILKRFKKVAKQESLF